MMKETGNRLNYWSAIGFLKRYMRGYRKHFMMFYAGWLADSLLAVLLPVLFGIMIDEAVYYRNLHSFGAVALVFLLCILFSGGLYFLLYAQHGYLMNMFVFSIRRDVFHHLQKCEAGYMANASTGEILVLLQDYPVQCMHFIVRNMIHLYNNVLMAILYGAYLCAVDWHIGLTALLSAFFSVLINMKCRKKIGSLGQEEREAYGSYAGWMYEVITALRDIRMLRGEGKIERTFEKKQKELFRIGAAAGISSLTAQNMIALSNLVIRLVIYGLAAYMAACGKMTLGTLTVIFSFYTKLSDKIAYISQNFLDAQGRVSYIQRIHDFLRAPTEPERTERLEIREGSISFSGVSFGYESGEPLLHRITLTIPAGKHMALVGKSGCGKTTLARLLVGFYRPQEGMIAIDGQRLDACALDSVREEIGYVQQDVLVFDGSIRQNLLMGNRHAAEEQLIRAYEEAGLAPFIESLPEGLDTIIGSKGMGLSGGQKQRLAIARIYLKNPKILIFDEATSALDNETENAIHQAWRKVLTGKTALVIAHRQSSVMLCDRCIILENGQVAETGIPARMAVESERFRTLFAMK
ncbi:MAG: ABC transporter ATP-binding protein/permease [Lachnospiraceae bacterium]|nr:ABC transporter ATP-binding protein/permease [Lachnospiraceae bacterium]